jgi:hypothetical protein
MGFWLFGFLSVAPAVLKLNMKKMRRNLPPCRSIRGRGTNIAALLFFFLFLDNLLRRAEGQGWKGFWPCSERFEVVVLFGMLSLVAQLCTGRELSAASIESTPETMTVTFDFSRTHDSFDHGDFFFNQSGDAPTDTRFRSDAKTAVNFQVFPSLTFAPTYEFFYCANKVQQHWFWENQASIQMKVRFDFWNRRHPLDQFKYKAPASPSK